jgi:outer membrane protein OmpA-like peptidoglycan-associated protein
MAVSAAVAEAVARAESEAQARAESEAREAFAAAAAAYGSAAPELQQVSLMLTRRRGELAEVERTLSERSAELNMMVASLHDRSISPELDPELVTTEATSTKPVADFADLDADLAKIREVLHPGLGRTEPAALTAPDTALTLVLFDSGSATLSMGGRTRIMAAAEALTAIGPTRVRIQAHTDTLGSAEGNARLARARAEAVATVFVEAGMDREMIDIAALGETADALPVATPDGVSEPLNRRVGVYTVPTTS